MQEKLLTATKSPRAGPSPGHHTTMVSRKPLHAKELQGKVIAFVALALVVTAALVALALYTKWQDAMNAQERQNANLARVLQEQTLRVLAPIDQATLRMRDAVAKGSFQPSDYTRLANETGLVPDILTQLAVIGADGRFVASNLGLIRK